MGLVTRTSENRVVGLQLGLSTEYSLGNSAALRCVFAFRTTFLQSLNSAVLAIH